MGYSNRMHSSEAVIVNPSRQCPRQDGGVQSPADRVLHRTMGWLEVPFFSSEGGGCASVQGVRTVPFTGLDAKRESECRFWSIGLGLEGI